jgi:hypothetical protein
LSLANKNFEFMRVFFKLLVLSKIKKSPEGDF